MQELKQFGEDENYRRLKPGEEILPGDEWYEGNRWREVIAPGIYKKNWRESLAPVRRRASK